MAEADASTISAPRMSPAVRRDRAALKREPPRADWRTRTMHALTGQRITLRLLLAFTMAALLAACAGLGRVSDYDEPTDRALTALHQQTDDFLALLIVKAPSDANAYAKHTAFYDEMDQRLRRLEFRVASIPKNGRTVDLVAKIRASLLGEGLCSADGASLKDLHCMPENAARGPSKTALQIARRNVHQTIGAALALELAKKQGLEQNK